LINDIDKDVQQRDLSMIYDWSTKNNMTFNSIKFELLRYGKQTELKSDTFYTTPEGLKIEEKNEVKDLGVLMASTNGFKSQIHKIANQAKKMASWILRTFRTRDKIPMLTLYKSLVRPFLEYCLPL